MKKSVVIIGGGFAGINLAKALVDSNQFSITLVDKNNYHFFPPLIYQVATGFLEPSSISYPFRRLLKGKENIRFWLGEFVRVNQEANEVELSNGTLKYDYLVFATGTDTNYFGMENVQKNAIPMKTLVDALNMRNLLLQHLEKASTIEDREEKKKLLTMVIAGGGPTGVEISGMFAEMKNTIIRKEYPELVNSALSGIYLVDGAPSLLTPMSKKSQEYALQSLTKLGVNVQFSKQVIDYDGNEVKFSDGTSIFTKNLIWAAGVTAMVFEGIDASCYGRGKRLIVDAFNKVQSTENIYAIGDTCYMDSDPSFPVGHPQVAQVAIQQGLLLAKNLQKIANPAPFIYNDKGSMAIIGKAKAVADLSPKVHFDGIIAWLAWLVIHIMSLINYRNKLRTLYNWMSAYFSNNSSLRMIVRPQKKML